MYRILSQEQESIPTTTLCLGDVFTFWYARDDVLAAKTSTNLAGTIDLPQHHAKAPHFRNSKHFRGNRLITIHKIRFATIYSRLPPSCKHDKAFIWQLRITTTTKRRPLLICTVPQGQHELDKRLIAPNLKETIVYAFNLLEST